MSVQVIEYTTKEYRNRKTGAKVHAAFPKGYVNEWYDKILEKAEEEYKDDPPGEYYKEGYNLYLRLKKYKESELRFLHDIRVPANNSLCERLARVYKRKQKQAITLRSQKNLEYICNGLSIVYLLRSKEEGSVYKEICDIYSRKRPIKSQRELTGTDA